MALVTILKVVPFILSLLTAILLVLVLIAGSNHYILSSFYLLKVDTSSLSLPAKLSSSAFLRDISKVSGQDYIGPSINPSTLGISTTYTVHVFTTCGHDASSDSSRCTTPLVGSSFDPMKNLRLDNTVLEGTYSPRLESALDGYNRVSPFLGAGFILAFVLALAAPSTMLLSKRAPKAAWLSVVMSAVCTILLIGAATAGTVTLSELNNAMNVEFGRVGIHSSTGPLLNPAWAAFGISLVNTIVLALIARTVPQGKHAIAAKDLKGKGPSQDLDPAKTMGVAATNNVPLLGTPQPPPPRLPFGVNGKPHDSQQYTSSSLDSSRRGSGVTAGSHSSRISGGDRVISETALNNTRRKEVNSSGYVPYQPLEEPISRY